VLYHDDSAQLMPLSPSQTLVIGRGRDADLQLNDESLSRRHASFTLSDDADTTRCDDPPPARAHPLHAGLGTGTAASSRRPAARILKLPSPSRIRKPRDLPPASSLR